MKNLKPFILAFFFGLIGFNALSQDKMDELLQERSILYKEYEFLEKQNSSFWGTKSKKDLKGIISNLKKIIIKDSEIIKEINIKSNQKNAEILSKNVVNQDWSAELENENNRLKLMLKKTSFDHNVLKEKTADLESAHNRNNTIIFVLILFVGGLIFYIFKLKQQFVRRYSGLS